MLMEIVRLADAVFALGVSESVTVTVKVVWPVAVGDPEITPVAVFSVNPGGRLALPPVTAQET